MIKSAVSASFDDHHDKMVIFRSFIAQISSNSPQQVETEFTGWKCVEDPSLICRLVAQAIAQVIFVAVLMVASFSIITMVMVARRGVLQNHCPLTAV